MRSAAPAPAANASDSSTPHHAIAGRRCSTRRATLIRRDPRTRGVTRRSARRWARSVARRPSCVHRASPARPSSSACRSARGARTAPTSARSRSAGRPASGAVSRAAGVRVAEQVQQRGRRRVRVAQRGCEAFTRAHQLRPRLVESVVAQPVDAWAQHARRRAADVRVVVQARRIAEQQVEAGVLRCPLPAARRGKARRHFRCAGTAGTSSPRDGASARAAASASRKLVTRPKRPERDRPSQVPPARRSRPARTPGSSLHQPSGAVGRSWNSSRLPATTSR